MKRWIHAATQNDSNEKFKKANHTYKVLTRNEAKKLSDAAYEGSEYNEWEPFWKAVQEIGHKYLTDPDEYDWFEQNAESLYQVKQVDELLAYELKNHEVYTITTDDDDEDNSSDDYRDDVYTEEWYIVMKGETSAEDTDGSPNYDSDDYLDCFDDIVSARKYAEKYVNNYRHTISASIWEATSIHYHDDDFHSDFSAELVEIVN